MIKRQKAQPEVYDYATWYSSDYWNHQRTYRDDTGTRHTYHGPGLAWDGFEPVAGALTHVFRPQSMRVVDGVAAPQNRVLDIGCGGGDLLRRMNTMGWDGYGVDISEYAVSHTSPSMQFRLGLADITTCPGELWPHVRERESEASIMSSGLPSMDPALKFPAQFDLVMATDLLEHIYEEDLEKTFSWLVSKSKRWLFFCVATQIDERNPLANSRPEFIQKKGEPIPLQWESTAAAGHVHVRHWSYWAKFFESHGTKIDWMRKSMFDMCREGHPKWRETGGWNMTTTWILRKL